MRLAWMPLTHAAILADAYPLRQILHRILMCLSGRAQAGLWRRMTSIGSSKFRNYYHELTQHCDQVNETCSCKRRREGIT